MREIILFLLILMIFFGSSSEETAVGKTIHKGSQNEFYNLKDKIQLLKSIYSSSCFDSNKNIIWTASPSDFPHIPLSYDNNFHTGIDTILYFMGSKNDSNALVILANYKIEIENKKEVATGSHFDGLSLGVALLCRENGLWKLKAIKKHLTYLGYYGLYRTGREDTGKIYLKELSKNWHCLCFRQGIGGNTGEFWGYEKFYSIDPNLPLCKPSEEFWDEINTREYEVFNELFTYNYHHNYYFPDLDNQNLIDINLKTLKTNCGLYKLQLDETKKNYSVETNKVNNLSKNVRIFYFSEELNVYLEEKKN